MSPRPPSAVPATTRPPRGAPHAPPPVPPGPAALVRRLAAADVVAALLGAAAAAALVAWPPMVGPDRYSYPFDPAWHTGAQLFFAVQHLGLLAGLVALAVVARHRRSRTGLVGAWAAAAGTVALTAAELFTITAADVAADSPRAALVGAAYGPAMLLVGAGAVLAGAGVVRARLLPGRSRWVPLALGVYVPLVLVPAVFGPMVAGRLAIGAWMLLFAALGVALRRAVPAPPRP